MSHDTIPYYGPNIGLRADGSASEGLGHLQRQLTLARTLRERFAWSPVFLTSTPDELQSLMMNRDEFTFYSISSEPAVAELCQSLSLSLLLCDLKDAISSSSVQQIQKTGTKVWLYSNTGDGRKVAEQNIFAFSHVASKLVDDYATLSCLASHDNTMMPVEFVRARKLAVDRPVSEICRLFVSMGGADEPFLTGQIVDALKGLEQKIELSLVVGFSFCHQAELEEKLASVDFPYRIYKTPEHFSSLAAQADLAITQMGNTLAELNCLGTATLLLNSTEFHSKVADYYSEDGSAVNLGLASDFNSTQLQKIIASWLSDKSGRHALRDAGLKKIDGRGVVRVANALFEELMADFVLVKCDVCGSDDFDALHILNGRPMVHCADCGLDYMNIRPSEELLQKVYAAEYFTAPRTQGDVSNYETDKQNVLRFARARLDALEKFLPQKGQLLDIGCALGFYLEEAQSRGWQVSGMDISDYAIDFTRKNLGIDELYKGTVETVDFPDDYFDAIICSLVFEHFHDPRACLEKIARWLRPGGYLALKVPHGGGVMYKFTPEKWFGSHPDNHFCDYTPDSLKRLLFSAGIKAEEWETEGIYLERFADALHLNDAQRQALMTIPGMKEKYQDFAANNLLGDSLVMIGRKL